MEASPHPRIDFLCMQRTSPSSKMMFAALFKRVRGYVLIELLDSLFLATAFTLLVIAISLPDQFIYYSGVASTSVAHTGTSGVAVNISSVNANVGAFYWRIGFSIPASAAMPAGFSYNSELRPIARDCTSTFDAPVGAQTIGVSCLDFQAFRVFYIAGLVSVGILTIIKLVETLRDIDMSRIPCFLWAVHGIIKLLAFCIPISQILMSKLIAADTNGSSALAPSYQLLIAALILSGLHGLLNLVRMLHKQAEAREAKKAAAAAAVQISNDSERNALAFAV